MSNRPAPTRAHRSRRAPRPRPGPNGLVSVGYHAYAGDEPLDLSGVDGLAPGLEQRRFGRGHLVVAVTDFDGWFRGFYDVRQTDPPELALMACLELDGRGEPGPTAAIAYSDEQVEWGPPDDDLDERFVRARCAAAVYGVHLVDWIQCGDEHLRSMKMATDPVDEWWDAPPA